MSSSHTPAPNQVVFTCVQRKSRSANLPPRRARAAAGVADSHCARSGPPLAGAPRAAATAHCAACARGSCGHGPLRTVPISPDLLTR